MPIRAQAIIIRDEKMLFAYGFAGNRNQLRHFFIGGAVETYETASQAVLRELQEEAQVKGEIIFQFSQEVAENARTFLIDIGDQKCILGYDPEESSLAAEDRSLKDIIWIDLKDKHKFTDIDKKYLVQLITECQLREYTPSWINTVREITQ
ncbi:MAG: hydrolase [Bacilli bacterium]|nr:hydrolase [Bacilli bacterium]